MEICTLFLNISGRSGDEGVWIEYDVGRNNHHFHNLASLKMPRKPVLNDQQFNREPRL